MEAIRPGEVEALEEEIGAVLAQPETGVILRIVVLGRPALEVKHLGSPRRDPGVGEPAAGYSNRSVISPVSRLTATTR